jgi:hypothetical protein
MHPHPEKHARWHHFVRWRKERQKPEHVMNFLTFVIAGTGVIGIILVIQGAQDTKRLVTAAEKQSTAAQRFSTSAAQISAGIQDAVAKLNVQANANQTMALAANTANSNSLEADRPWMGGTLNVADFAVGKTPTYTVSFMNSGKRPAKVTLTQTLDAARDFGNNPTYAAYDTTPSMSFVVPGQGLASSWTDKDPLMTPISSDLMKAITTVPAIPFRIYARIEYMDLRTNKKYWTHLCWRYTPAYATTSGGFTNCPEYNDAK